MNDEATVFIVDDDEEVYLKLGREMLVRFEYDFQGGSYWGGSGAVWLDNICFTNVEQLAATVLHDSLAPGVTTAAVTGRVDGLYLYTLENDELVRSVSGVHDQEHSIEMQLPLLQHSLAPGWRLLPVLVGQIEDSAVREAARLIRPLVDADTLVVASSDFTHYGRRFRYMPFPHDRSTR